MGYSCNTVSMMVYDEMIVQLQGASSKEHTSQNTWDHNGLDHFAEIGREQRDGAVTGSVWAMLPDGARCRKVGSFRINPGGKVARWPSSTKAQRWTAQQAGQGKYQETYQIPFMVLE